MQVRAFERYIPLNQFHSTNLALNSDVNLDTFGEVYDTKSIV